MCRVTNMKFMFMKTSAFNVDISKWYVSSVTNMDSMFWEAISFKRKLCGDAWVHSTASKRRMFRASSGSILRTVCTSTTFVYQHLLTERDLKIVRAPNTIPVSTMPLPISATNNMMCAKCSTFKKSGRVSCCAPGGAWYKNCGGIGNRNADHSWIEGLEACKCKSKAKPFR